MTEVTIAHLQAAREASETFSSDTRTDGSRYIKCSADGGSWIYRAIFDAHAGMMPDDTRYEFVSEAFDRIADASIGTDTDELAHEFADDVDVYTSALCDWLGSRVERPAYCDEAVEEGLIEPDADMSRRMMVGQYLERREVFGYVADAVETRASELLEEWTEDARARGCSDATAAASWIVDGNTDVEAAKRLVRMIEDGDPAADDYYPRRPDLSGEFADGPTPLSLAREITGHDEIDADTIEAVSDAYEEGVSDTFTDACEVELRSFVGEER